MSSGPRFIWFPASGGASLFPCSLPAVSPERPSTRSLVPRFHSFFESVPLQSSFTLTSVHGLSARTICQGFGPSSRHPRRASTFTREVSNPRFVPSTGVRSLPTVFSALRLRSFFHPRAVSRALPVQGLLSPHSCPPSSGGAAPLPLALPALVGPYDPAATQRAPRLRGLTPREAAFWSVQGLAGPIVAPLVRFRLLQVHPPRREHRLPSAIHP